MPDDQQAVSEALEWQQVEIAGQIHDDLLPYLFAASASLHAAQRQLKTEAAAVTTTGSSETAESVATARQCIDTAQSIARRILSGLVLPAEVTAHPLTAARDSLQQLLSMTAESSPEIVWTGCEAAEQSIGQFAPAVATGLYRLVWESVRNAVRHARSSRIDVSARCDNQILTINISDDGIGIDPQAASEATGVGRRLMRQRAEAAGIDLSVRRGLRGGTEVTLVVSLAAN